MPKRNLAALTRGAAIHLAFNVALILCATSLVLALILTDTPPTKPEAFYTDLPGVDLTRLPPEKKAALLKQLNRQRCTCDCGRSVASCRNNHGSCSLSLAAAREAVEAARKR
jgi:hypothetical protein